jgi:hypothetical protein
MPAKKLFKMVNAVEELRDEEVDATAESSDEEMLKLKMRLQCGKSFMMDFWMYDTLNFVKQQVMSHLGKGLRDMKVYLGSRELKDEFTLQHQRVKDKDELWIVYSTGVGDAPSSASAAATGAPSSASAAATGASSIRIRGSAAGASSSSAAAAPSIRIRGSAGGASSSSAAAASASAAASPIIGDPVIGDILECLDNLNSRIRRIEEHLGL